MVSRDFVAGVVAAVVHNYPQKAGGMMSYEAGDGKPVVIQTSFDIPKKLRQQITDVLADQKSPSEPDGVTDVRFEQLPVHRV